MHLFLCDADTRGGVADGRRNTTTISRAGAPERRPHAARRKHQEGHFPDECLLIA